MHPTSDFIDGLDWLLGMQSIQSEIEERRPDLVGRVTVVEQARSFIKIDIGPDHQGYNRAVYLAVGVEKRGDTSSWMVIAPGINVDSFWSVDLPRSAVIGATLMAVEHAATTSGYHDSLPDLLRWAEPHEGVATRLADALDARGVTVGAVVGENRLVQHLSIDSWRRTTVAESIGQAVRIDCAWGQATVAYRPVLGWVMDIPNMFSWERPWRWALPGNLTVAPGRTDPVPSSSPDRIADVVAERAALAIDEYLDNVQNQHESLQSDDPGLHGLAQLGFSEVPRYAEWENGIEHGRDVVFVKIDRKMPVGKPLITGRVGELYGTPKPVVILSDSGFTREAIKWADSLDIMLFRTSERAAQAASRSARPVDIQTIPHDRAS